MNFLNEDSNSERFRRISR